jgi:glycosyltransferase involved in cell wall biosynthesis
MDAVTPMKPMGGTEIMVAGLEKHLGDALDRVTVGVNCLPNDRTKPIICWLHHDYNQPAVQWLRDDAAVQHVDAFVFVSHWQRERFQMIFRLPPERCHVLRNAVDWRQDVHSRTGRRFAYTSTPFRGLDVLLAAWERAEMPEDAELHLFTSMALYGLSDAPYEALYDRARKLPGVIYHGFKPNHEVRDALAGMDFLAYPATWEETSCLSVIEAMAAGCQVICPTYGALPETTAGFARMYPWIENPKEHARVFAHMLETAIPGTPAMQAAYTRMVYAWDNRAIQWRQLIGSLVA